jgi:Phage integrase family
VQRFDQFQQYCQQHGHPTSTPPYEAVGDFLIAFQLRNDGHTASLPGVLSNLRTQYRKRGIPFLTTQSEALISALLAQLRLCDTTPVNAKSPLRFLLIVRIIAKMDLTDVTQLQEGTALSFGNNSLLRTKEATAGLRASDFIWKQHSVVVHLKPTKTERSGAGVFIEVHESTHPFSGVQMLRRLWKNRDLDNHPDEFVFCRIDHRKTGARLVPTIPASATSYRILIKSAVASIGLNPKNYSGHSLRAGGATDLFAAGTPYYVIKKMGRWTSDAALLYFRSESSVARMAAQAFNI